MTARVVSIAAGSVLAASAARAAGPTADCATMSVIGVRGTDESGNGFGAARNNRVWEGQGWGSKLDPLVKKIRDDNPNMTVNVMGLKYDASGAAMYSASVNAGKNILIQELNWIMSTCSVKPMVMLLGYSQGAHVIVDALNGDRMSSVAKGQVKAAMVFGDPSYMSPAGYNAQGNGTSDGLFPRWASDVTKLEGLKNAYGQHRTAACQSDSV